MILFGKRYRDRGPFYLWPVVVFAKLPLGLTLLALIGVVALIRYGIPHPGGFLSPRWPCSLRCSSFS
ncbi:MAG: hypothetical protein ACXW5U_15805 [Thermoanaerobaculia bacterium]